MDLKQQIAALTTKVDTMEQRLRKEFFEDKYILVLGSVAYNYINAAAQYVYGKDKYQDKIEVGGNFTFSKLDKEEFSHTMTADEKQRWTEFKQRFWKPEFAKIISKCKGPDRVESAHPTRLPSCKTVPTPTELKGIIPDNFFEEAAQVRET
jgi:hypothetical protein